MHLYEPKSSYFHSYNTELATHTKFRINLIFLYNTVSHWYSRSTTYYMNQYQEFHSTVTWTLNSSFVSPRFKYVLYGPMPNHTYDKTECGTYAAYGIWFLISIFNVILNLHFTSYYLFFLFGFSYFLCSLLKTNIYIITLFISNI